VKSGELPQEEKKEKEEKLDLSGLEEIVPKDKGFEGAGEEEKKSEEDESKEKIMKPMMKIEEAGLEEELKLPVDEIGAKHGEFEEIIEPIDEISGSEDE
jgi:hypothetical protein